MIFIKNSEEYPRYVGDIESDSPGWQLGQALPYGWEAVTETAPPQRTADFFIVEKFPEKIDGLWYQSWELSPITEADKAGLELANEELQSRKSIYSRQP